jgi:small redox-active disulfide protein 2
MIIKILGTGCAKCKKLEANALEATQGMNVEVQKVTDINEIMNYGVMMTPALVIDEKVVAVGKVLSADKIKDYIK